MVADARLVFEVEARQPLTLSIEVSGSDVAWFHGNREPEHEQSDDAVPDLVERWTRAINAGILGDSVVRPETCAAKIVARRRRDLQQVWTVQIARVSWGALRVLGNLLLARRLDQVAIRSDISPGDPVARLAMDGVSFPRFDERLPFVVERAEVLKGSRGRGVKLGFAGPLPEPDVDSTIADLDLWAELVTWGGYAAPGIDPRQSGALPDGAFLYDEVTISQTFTEAFFADEAAFEAAIGYALASRARHLPVVEVLIQ